jgi:hypothetical protein
MSLLGRLEDLSLTDIIQIVYLSRRTGVLEIINDNGRHTVLFRQGLVVNAASPEHPDLVAFLQAAELVKPQQASLVRQMEDSGIPAGVALLEMNVLSKDDLGNAVRQRILNVVTPLLVSKEGEFNFILSESMSPADLEYEPDQLFREGGFPPNKLLGAGEGEKIKPLRGLEESLKAGKALLRGSAPAETTPASLNLGLGQPLEPPQAPPRLPGTAPSPADNVLPFPAPREEFTAIDELPALEESDPAVPEAPPELASSRPAATRQPSGQFRVAGGLFEVESPDAAYRNVVLFERNPLVRVAARRQFLRHLPRADQRRWGGSPDAAAEAQEPAPPGRRHRRRG